MCHDLSVPGFCCPSRKLWKQNSSRSAWSEWPVKNQVRHTLHSLPSPTVVLQQRPSRWSVALPFLFLFFNIYLFIWLHWVLVRACSIFMALYGIFSLWPTDSLVVGPRLIVTAHGLSCSMACGILVPQLRSKPTSLALQSGILTTGSPGKYPLHFLYASGCHTW